MKHLFLIVDCSGSVIRIDTTLVKLLNDMLRNIVDKCAEQTEAIHVVTYSDVAHKQHTYRKGDDYVDIPEDVFGGRSSLGRAYSLIVGIIVAQRIDLSDCVIALVTDGEATDDYAKRLDKLDPDNKSVRLVLCSGRTTALTERHATKPEYCFEGGNAKGFVEAILDCLHE